MNKASIAIALLLLCATLVASEKKSEEDCIAEANTARNDPDPDNEITAANKDEKMTEDEKTAFEACKKEEKAAKKKKKRGKQ